MKKIIIVILMVLFLVAGCSKITDKTDVNSSQDVEDENPVANVTIDSFNTQDYRGNQVNQSVFKDKAITVLNLWATWCGPCVEEIPELQKVAEAYKDKNVQIIGLAVDSDEEEVKALKEKLGITYMLMKSNEILDKAIVEKFDYIPVTLFVNSDGKILETFIPGGVSEKELSDKIEALINE